MLSFLLVLSVNQLSFIDKSNLLNYFQCHCVSEISADKNVRNMPKIGCSESFLSEV